MKISFITASIVALLPFALTADIRAEAETESSIASDASFWSIEKTADDIWWFVSPNGDREFMNTVTNVQPIQLGRDANGPHYVSKDWPGPIDHVVAFTDQALTQAWAPPTLARIYDAGFKGFGAWCHHVFHTLDVPIARDLNLWRGVNEGVRFYDPRWKRATRKAIAVRVGALKDDPNVIGYYTDNEMHWRKTQGPSIYFDGLSPESPSRQEVTSLLRETWPELEDFNTAWNTSLGDWDEIDLWPALPTQPAATAEHLMQLWLLKLATDYFTFTTHEIRKVDPHHLILGVRFAGYGPLQVVEASRGLTDAVSINIYVGDARLDYSWFTSAYKLSEQPIIISEYAFHSLDNRSGAMDTFGFPGGQVVDQKARAEGYRIFTKRLAEVPYIIGADWFQWNDEPPSGRFDGEDVNFGIVDIYDEPYTLLVDAVRETTPLLNDLHANASGDRRDHPIWLKPTKADSLNIRRLETAPKIDGDLSDWPAIGSRSTLTLQPLQIMGIERIDLNPPRLHLGWQNNGLYLAAEIEDRTLAGSPSADTWWSGDTFEFWIATQPAAKGQAGFDKNSHQFFFRPPSDPASPHDQGTVGQWHRPGDALTRSLIPHPEIEHAFIQTPRGYIFECWIPSTALHGFAPAKSPRIAFNAVVSDATAPVEFFWSAAKGQKTHERPSTWGPATLVAD